MSATVPRDPMAQDLYDKALTAWKGADFAAAKKYVTDALRFAPDWQEARALSDRLALASGEQTPGQICGGMDSLTEAKVVAEFRRRFDLGTSSLVAGDYVRAGEHFDYVVLLAKYSPYENSEIARGAVLAKDRAETAAALLGDHATPEHRTEGASEPVQRTLVDSILERRHRDPVREASLRSDVMAVVAATTMSPDFQGTPLPVVVTYMRAVSRLNILVDEESVERVEEVRVTWSALGQRLSSLLDEVARQCRLHWVIEQGTIILTRRP